MNWIKVSECLPANDDYILLSFSNYDLVSIGRYEKDDEGGAFYLSDSDKSLVSYGIFVNAWMPLPGPFRGDL